MTTAPPETDIGPSPPDASVLGTSVLTVGPGDDGSDVVALWNLGPSGMATGAWVLDSDIALGDATAARRLLICLDGRAVTGVDLPSVTATLQRLATAAELSVAADWWESRSFEPPAAFVEVLARRQAFEATIEARRATTKNIAALEWPRDYSAGGSPATFDDLRALSPLGIAPGPPAVSAALTVSQVLRWVVGLWAETEQAKGRRAYLRDEDGAPEPLPPSWRAATRAAGSTRLPL